MSALSGSREPSQSPLSRPIGFDPERIAAELTDLERELLTGTAKGWGSWMFMVGADLCAKGLGRRDGRGSIYLDTPAADAVRAAIAAGSREGHDSEAWRGAKQARAAIAQPSTPNEDGL